MKPYTILTPPRLKVELDMLHWKAPPTILTEASKLWTTTINQTIWPVIKPAYLEHTAKKEITYCGINIAIRMPAPEQDTSLELFSFHKHEEHDHVILIPLGHSGMDSNHGGTAISANDHIWIPRIPFGAALMFTGNTNHAITKNISAEPRLCAAFFINAA